MITQQPLTAIHPASSVWDTKDKYESSYINTWLNDYFLNSLDGSIQNNILYSTYNVGIYGSNESEQNISEIIVTQKVGLLDVEQYLRAGSMDSFLDIKDFWWLANRYDSSNFLNNVFYEGTLEQNTSLAAIGVRPVITINDIFIDAGLGTISSSYMLTKKTQNINDIQIGEYVNVPYGGSDNACGNDNLCTFRVVSKDDDSIKVVLNGLLSKKSIYGSSSTITTNSTIYNILNDFANNIDTTYRYTENKVFYIGDYPNIENTGHNYTDIMNKILESSVGLPIVGEMFSANDIDLSLSSTKTFVDSDTIENLTISQDYWTMNSFLPLVRCISLNGDLYYFENSYESGVRPVIYLKSGLTFTSGEGTAQSPYTLE